MRARYWFAIVCAGALVAGTAAAQNCAIEDEFVEFDDAVWQLMGNAAHDEGTESVVLTLASGNQAGAFYSFETISTENLEVWFTAQIGGGNSADGMAMVIIEGDTLPAAVTPPCGSCMGFSGWTGRMFHVELDTYGGGNDFETNGGTANHIGVGYTTTGYNAGTPFTQPSASVRLPNDIRGEPLGVHVLLEEGVVTVEVQNKTWAPDWTVIIDQVEIDNWDGDFEGLIGFSGATGGATDRHEVLDVCVGDEVRCPKAPAATCTGAGGVQLSWKNGSVIPTSVQIARDGTVIAASAPADPPVFVDANPGLGAHTYVLTFTMSDGPPPCTFDAPVQVEVFRNDDVSPWTSVNIGSAICGGIEKVAEGFDIHGAGADIGGGADGFRFTYQEYEGDFDLVARVDSLDETDADAKAGLMARATLDKGAPMACIFATPPGVGTGVDMRWRDTAGGTSGAQGSTGAMDLPLFLRLVRIGANFSGSYSTDGGATWTTHVTHPVSAMGQKILVGMAVTSRVRATATTAAFRNVAIECLNICPTDVKAVCNGTDVVLTWSNIYDYTRVRVYRVDAAGVSKRVASIGGTLETYTDKTAAALPAGKMQYQIVPVIGTSEILSCQKAPSPGCGAGEGSIVCIQWPACTPCDGGPRFIRGDTDGDGRYIISDGIQILDRLFSGRQAFGSNCDDTGDFDDSGALDLGDAISVFNFLFAQGREPKAPYPGCGEDPTADDLPCAGPNPACP